MNVAYKRAHLMISAFFSSGKISSPEKAILRDLAHNDSLYIAASTFAKKSFEVIRNQA